MIKRIKTEVIDNYMAKHRLSKTAFCKLCKISPTTLTKVYSGLKYSIVILYKISVAMNVDILEFFKVDK